MYTRYAPYPLPPHRSPVKRRQNLCGMSVVGGDWEVLKRYNLNELYPSGAGESASRRPNEAAERAAHA